MNRSIPFRFKIQIGLTPAFKLGDKQMLMGWALALIAAEVKGKFKMSGLKPGSSMDIKSPA
jgi:hypothetical protein